MSSSMPCYVAAVPRSHTNWRRKKVYTPREHPKERIQENEIDCADSDAALKLLAPKGV